MASCRRHEPAPKGFLKVIVSEKPGEEVFYNKEYLTRFNSNSKSKRHEIPGHGYFNSIDSFFELHCKRGELYFESVLKGDCSRKGEQPGGWVGGGGVLELIFAGYVPLASQSPYPYSVANYRLHLRHFWANM